MKRVFNIKAKNIILVFTIFIVLAGCGQHQQWNRIEHPGSYELINMGDIDLNGERVRVTKAHDKIFYSFIQTNGPSFYSTYLLEHTEVKKGESVLDMGTGSGIQAIFAAENAGRVLATDITERTLENTILNARYHGVSDKIAVRKSDLFDDIKPEEKFDVIIVNIPFPWYDESEENWKLLERFFRDTGKHLNPHGRIYFLGGILDNLPRTHKIIEKNRLKIMHVNMTYIDNNDNDYELLVYHIQHAPPPTKQANIDKTKS